MEKDESEERHPQSSGNGNKKLSEVKVLEYVLALSAPTLCQSLTGYLDFLDRSVPLKESLSDVFHPPRVSLST